MRLQGGAQVQADVREAAQQVGALRLVHALQQRRREERHIQLHLRPRHVLQRGCKVLDFLGILLSTPHRSCQHDTKQCALTLQAGAR